MAIHEVTVTDLAKKRTDGESFVLLDVRRPDEIAQASIAWARHIPMDEIETRIGELPADVPIYVMCHGGVRSAHVTRFLNDNGFPRAVNVAGGIRSWSRLVDPSVPDYD